MGPSSYVDSDYYNQLFIVLRNIRKHRGVPGPSFRGRGSEKSSVHYMHLFFIRKITIIFMYLRCVAANGD